MNPLALMIRPRGSSPHHSLALVLALTAIRASEPLPLVHIISSTPSMLIALAAKTPYRIASSFRRDRPVVVLAASLMAFAMAQRRAGAHHQKLAQVGVEGSNSLRPLQ